MTPGHCGQFGRVPMHRVQVDVLVRHRPTETEEKILKDQANRWAKRFCLEPLEVSVH